ncbi:MAG: sucrose phosphorylase [Steroidobacteraceae bacterium]
MKNQVQLITYVDRFGGGTLHQLEALLAGPLAGLFGTVHLLPFFDPIDGADAGFDPIDHTRVDARLGNWEDLARLGRRIDLMADVIVNHMSCESRQFKDFSRRGHESAYDGLFLTLEAVFPVGAHEHELTAIYRPRPGLPLTPVTLENGEKRILWTTFTPQQLDIDVRHCQGRAYLESILRTFSSHGIRAIRLDAVGYAIKRAGTSCFMLPETFEFIDELTALARSLDMEVLVEVHSHYLRQLDIAARVDWVYDFALPPLVLHALFSGTARHLKHWIEIRPHNALTVLDTHDGIGVIDVGPEAGGGRDGLLPAADIERLVETIHERSGGQSRRATGAAASNLDLYQVNCTFYDALGRNDQHYLLARAVQFFLPGIPQVYYVGLLGGGNDMALLEKTGVGRDINRRRYSTPEVLSELKRPLCADLRRLIRLRNTHPAFNGELLCGRTPHNVLALRWQADSSYAELVADFSTGKWTVRHGGDGACESLHVASGGSPWAEMPRDIEWCG